MGYFGGKHRFEPGIPHQPPQSIGSIAARSRPRVGKRMFRSASFFRARPI